jgi:hypothetical protein
MIKSEMVSMMRNVLTGLLILISFMPLVAQNVGINTTTPLSILHVDLGASLSNGILFSGLDPSGGSFPSLGAGHRLMYYPGKGVFRAGYVDNTQWDNSQVGAFSFAFGYNTIAKGNGSTAFGDATYAGGSISSAFGNSTNTKGYSSFVMGMYNDPLINGPDQDVETPQTPLLMVGNGDGNSTRNNALAIFKNGDVLLRNYSTVLADPGVILPPVTGPGTRMMWLAEKSAFRLGTVHNNDWNADSIGTWSTGIGYSTKAKGQFSLALGVQTKAIGLTSTALGYSTEASGENSIAMGSVTIASGANATTLGFKTIAKSYGSVSMGRYNDKIISSNSTAWVNEDPLLIVGNGTSDADPHNTLVVYKNGNLVLKNPTTIAIAPGVIPTPIDGSGTRMMWLPEKSAFRVGTTQTSSWDGANIGAWSFASGLSTEASGSASTALGIFTKADGSGSTAMGTETVSSGYSSLASGGENTAFGNYSTAMGYVNRAMGAISSVSGHFNIAKGYASTVIGLCNDSILVTDQNSINPITPLFIIGNGDGTGAGQRRNAMVVRKDGHVGIGTSVPNTFLHVNVGSSQTDGIFIQGLYNAGGTVPNSGSGSRMLYYPAKAVFRAGSVTGTEWDNSNCGTRSFAVGFNTKASGPESAAFGFATIASGTRSTAMGYSSIANGENAVSMGRECEATGVSSTALGYGSIASGDISFASGFESKANGYISTATGVSTAARSYFSSASGYHTIAKGYASTVVGVNNDSILLNNQTTLVDATPLFIVCNGESEGLRNNALVIYKSGNADIDGYTRLGDSTTTSNVPRIKMKKLTGTSAATQNAWTNIAHGLTMSKILSVNIIMSIPGFVNLPPSYTYQTGYEYQYQVAASNIVVINSATNSSNILSKTFTILIVYEE